MSCNFIVVEKKSNGLLNRTPVSVEVKLDILQKVGFQLCIKISMRP
jgi:hypothetical protein